MLPKRKKTATYYNICAHASACTAIGNIIDCASVVEPIVVADVKQGVHFVSMLPNGRKQLLPGMYISYASEVEN